MKKIDIVGIAFSNFKRRKTRSILTVLGVVIGVASIVTMVSLGIAVNESITGQIENMGDLTTVKVWPGYDATTGKQKELDDEAVAAFEQIDKVKLVSPEISVDGKMVSGKWLNYGNIIGVRAEYLEELGFETEQGTLEGLTTATGKKINCLFGSEIGYQFYKPSSGGGGGMSISFGGMGMGGEEAQEREPPPVDPMDEFTKIKFTFDWSYGEKNPGFSDNSGPPVLYNMNVLGVLKQTGGQQDYRIYVDMDTARKLKKEQEKMYNSGGQQSGGKKKETYGSINVIAGSIDDTMQILQQVKNLGYDGYSSAEVVQSMQQITGILQLVLGGIGGISLLVAAIGIINTMIMAIYERTREIGIMKVIGCQLKDIRTMFLCEAAFIGLFGGAFGLIISYALSFLLNIIGGGGIGMFGMGGGAGTKLSVIPPWLAIIAVVFAMLVGLVSGVLPARRAMKLSALEAMRN